MALGLSPDHHRKTSEFCYKRDIEAILERLADLGHEARPLNLHPGTTSVDEHIDLPPYALPHLKLRVADYVSTSIGLVAREGTR